MPPRTRKLHPVPDSDPTEPAPPAPAKPSKSAANPRPKTVTAAAAGGDELELLVALRTRLARSVQSPKTAARDLAALTRQLREVARDIAALEAADREDGITRAASTPDEPWDSEAI